MRTFALRGKAFIRLEACFHSIDHRLALLLQECKCLLDPPPGIGAGDEYESKIGMRNQTASSIPFQRKIAEFCNVRLAPLVSK
jgi:hypothetical protein